MPGLRGALEVRVNDGKRDTFVTRYCRNLKFTKVAPGGHRSLGFKMILPRKVFTDLGPQDRVYVYDRRTGRTIVEGYTENPTPTDGPGGQQYDLSAVGGMALANDETRGLIYVDKSLDDFERATDSTTVGDIETGMWSDDPNYKRLRVAYPGGSLVPAGLWVSADNSTFLRAGMNLGGIRIGQVDGGKTDASWVVDFVTFSGIVAGTGTTLTNLGGTLTIYVGVSNFPTGSQEFALRLRRNGGAVNVADDLTFVDFADYSVIGQRMDRNGTLLTGSGGLVSASQVLASQVAEDILGRLLTFCDPRSAQIDTTTFGITQLAWPDGVKAADVLTRLGDFEPGYLWEILETGDNGKHRFNYRAWPTTARYEVSNEDGWKQTGSDSDLCNRILVSWTDATGKPQVTPVTAASLGLTDPLPGRIKDAEPISLPDGRGSAANATQVGAAILRDKIDPPKAGTVVVRRPVMDTATGRRVMPWEIEPGYLCRVREIGDDLPITQADYDDDDCSMLLTLGTPPLTDEQRVARLPRNF